MERIIKIVDTGTERYTLNPQQIVLGRMYDNNSEKITINRPNAEKDSVCTMIITDVSGKVIDCVIITDKTYTITNTISAHQFVKIGFSFSRPDGYVKGTEIALGKFLPAAKPDGLVLVEPEQQKNINYLIAYGVTDSRLSGNALEFFNMNGDKVVSFDLSPFMQAQSDLGETKEIKRLSNVAISTIFNNISIDNIKVIKIRFRADTNFNGVSYDQSVNESGILMTNYSASNSALIATANETLVLYKSYNYESNYEFAVGNYKLSVSNGSMPKLSYYGIQYKTELNSAHWIIAESTTDFKVDAEIEIEG